MRTKNAVDNTIRNVLEKKAEILSSSDLNAISGTDLAKALIKRIALVGASGYSNELIVNGENWSIGIAKTS